LTVALLIAPSMLSLKKANKLMMLENTSHH
jgi:hypothetical protein